MPSPEVMAAAAAGASTVAVPNGSDERGGYIVEFPQAPTGADADPNTGLVTALRFKPMVLRPSSGVKPGATDSVNTLTIPIPANAEAGIHGHIDSGPEASDGFVDSVAANKGYGDTMALSLGFPVPMATVSRGQVGWHVLDRGQLKFIYPQGAMSPSEMRQMQQNLDKEQLQFQRQR